MRNLKKFLALVLATLMVISAAATVSAYSDVADDDTYAAAIAALTEYGIVNGTNAELDTFSPDDDVVRYQMALMMARALEPDTEDWQEGMAIFEDVTEWYGAIAYAYMNGIVTGMDATHFEPKTGIKCRDALIMAVRALGYEVDVTLTPYWIGAYQTAAKIGLTNNLKVNDPAKTLTRAETAQVIYNMLKATPADGGATIEEKNFGVAGDSNVTTFVITATPNQAYADGAKAVEAGYVGIQPLVNGIPNGAIVYIPSEMIGIDADDVDNYFNYSVDLVNYVEKTGKFDKAVIGADPTVVYSTNLTVANGKVTINSIPYYPATEITGAALKNEIVIYAGGSDAREARILLKDSDGDIIDQNGKKVAIYAYQAPNGTKYYADQLKAKVISEATALEDYGVIVEGSYTEYETLTYDKLSTESNYQFTLFDDNNDGKFDRAIWAPVYMSVFNTAKSNGEVNIKSDAFAASKTGVKFDTTLKKGQIFVYTYNKQLNKVNVIEVLTESEGVIEALNLTEYKHQTGGNAKKDYLATITISGKDYKIANTAQEKYTGAALCETTTDAIDYSKITSDAVLNYTNSELDIEDVVYFANIGSHIKFYEFNGYLIAAATYDIEEAFDYMVVVSAEDYDETGVFVDAYINGVRGTYHIAQYKNSKDEIVDFSNLSVFALNNAIQTFANGVAGQVYKTISVGEDSYQVSQAFRKTVYDYVDLKSQVVFNTTSFKLYEATDRTYEFVNGVSKLVNTKATRLRTNENTKFYFINTSDNSISLFTGKLADGYKITTSGTDNGYGLRVFADKLGFGTDSKVNGVANTVIVYYNNGNKAAISGFDLSSITNAIVYIANPGTYTVGSASDFGLTGKSGTYFKYGEVAVNMASGKKMAVYATKSFAQNIDEEADKGVDVQGFYEVDGMGILTKKLNVNDYRLATASITKSGVDLADEYVTIKNTSGTVILNVGAEVTKVITSLNNELKIKENKDNLSDTAKKVYFLKNLDQNNSSLIGDYADGVVVLIVGEVVTGGPKPVDPVEGEVTIVTNAQYVKSVNAINAANFASEIKDGKLTGTLTICDAAFKGWDETVTGMQVKFVNTYEGKDVKYSIKTITVNGKEANPAKYDFTASATTDGTLAVSMSAKRINYSDSTELAAGNYTVTIKNSTGNSEVYVINFTK